MRDHLLFFYCFPGLIVSWMSRERSHSWVDDVKVFGTSSVVGSLVAADTDQTDSSHDFGVSDDDG